MSEHSLLLVDALRRRLSVARRRVALSEVAFGLLVTAGVVAALLGLGAAAEAVMWLGSGARWALVAVTVLAAAALLAAFVVIPLLRLAGVLPGLDDGSLARRVGLRYPEVSDRLANLLDLADGRGGAAPGALVDGAVQMLGRQIEPVPFERVEDLAPVRRAAPVAAFPVAGVLLALLVAPAGFGDAMGRLLAPGATFAPPAPFALSVEPGSVEVVRGGDLALRVVASGEARPRTVMLEVSREGERRVEELRLLMDERGEFRHTESALRTDLRYRAVAEGVASPWYQATVIARPVVSGMQVTLRPPRYTGLPPQQLPPDVGDITALPGTTVELRVRTDGAAVDSAALVFDSGAVAPLAVRGTEASGRFSVAREDAYRLALRSPEGHLNADPIPYTIRTLTDAAPQIRLLAPVDGVLNESLVTRVAARVTDDFGFSRAALRYRLAERDGAAVESDFAELEIPIRPDVLDQDIAREWLLGASGLNLRPGDAVAFYVQVWDNNAVAGYQSARTPVQHLRFPSVREQFERLDEAEDSARQGLDRMREEADDARRRFDELRDQIRRNQDADWEDRRQLDRLMQQQQNLDDSVRESVEQMQDVLDRMRENDLVSEDTQRLYEQLQRVIEEIGDPDLMEHLRQLQEAMEQMNLEQMLQSMQNFDFDEQQFRDRLERALELFERLRTAKELEEAAARAEDLARMEEQLADDTGALEDARQQGEASDTDAQVEQERLAEQQRQAAEAAEALKQELEQLQERMDGQAGGAQMSEQLEQMQEQLDQAQQQMQENMEQLQEGQLQDAQQGQQQLQQMMQQMQEALASMGQQMAGQQQQRNVSGVRRVIDDVLTLSFEQESLRARSSQQRPDSPAIRQSAQQQVDLAAGLGTVADSLRALAREIPEMERAIQERAGTAIREMGAATESLADRRPPEASGHQKGAMTSLNDLAVLLADLLDQMMGGSGGGGGEMSLQQMMQQLQQMSGDQQMLNQQIQQMLNDMQGQRLSVDQQQRLQQMRQQQQMLQQQLEEMIQSGNLDGQTRSELQRIAEEMEDAVRRMEGGRLDRDLRDQQQRILTRLLEAHESMNQRGRSDEREGSPPDESPRERQGPADLPEREEADRLRRDLIRALESGYAPDYQELIKRYFELLQWRTEE